MGACVNNLGRRAAGGEGWRRVRALLSDPPKPRRRTYGERPCAPHMEACRRTQTRGSAPRSGCQGGVRAGDHQPEPGRAPRSDASDQQHRRAQRGLPDALTGARELVRPGEEVLILSDSQIAICTPRLAHGRRARTRRWSTRGEPWRPCGPMARRCGSSTFERMPATE